MPDPRFFTRHGPFTLGAIAKISGASLLSDADLEYTVSDISPLAAAGPDDLSFIDNPRYAADFSASSAGACLVNGARAQEAPPGMALLLSETPYLAYARAATAFYPDIRPVEAVAPIDPTASIGDGTRLAPGVFIGPGAEIGRDCDIGPNVIIGQGVVVGDECRIAAGASLACCILGKNVRIYAGVRIGEPGFGFAVGDAGFLTVPQLGRVLIGDGVEIGANTTIDRGSGPDTVIGAGTRIDNLVQIGHNVRVGCNCIIVALVGISGSVTLEDGVVVGGQVGIAGHLTVGAGAQIGAQSGVNRDVSAGARLQGTPAVPVRQFYRQAAYLERLMTEKKVRKDG
ncbi:MAG: UDP-3-O-(3-hydroxymyristoyl)glucosamine N-acyltransferase [Alphaproteobacteria bacterium]